MGARAAHPPLLRARAFPQPAFEPRLLLSLTAALATATLPVMRSEDAELAELLRQPPAGESAPGRSAAPVPRFGPRGKLAVPRPAQTALPPEAVEVGPDRPGTAAWADAPGAARASAAAAAPKSGASAAAAEGRHSLVWLADAYCRSDPPRNIGDDMCAIWAPALELAGVGPATSSSTALVPDQLDALTS